MLPQNLILFAMTVTTSMCAPLPNDEHIPGDIIVDLDPAPSWLNLKAWPKNVKVTTGSSLSFGGSESSDIDLESFGE
jgi:hypothetical protein